MSFKEANLIIMMTGWFADTDWDLNGSYVFNNVEVRVTNK